MILSLLDKPFKLNEILGIMLSRKDFLIRAYFPILIICSILANDGPLFNVLTVPIRFKC